jgi:hypothetical protein
MKHFIPIVVAFSVWAVPVRAEPGGVTGNAVASAALGSGAGFVRGGSVDTAAGAGVGGTVGAGSASRPREATIIEHPSAQPIHERTCARDSLGHVLCQEAAH